MKTQHLIFLITCILQGAHAQIAQVLEIKPISINFTNGAGANSLAESAGVVKISEWTNLTLAATGEEKAGPATVVWEVKEFVNSKSPVKGVSTGYPDRIFRSQLRTNSFAEDALTITVRDLPPALQTGMDIIIYWSNPDTANRVSRYQKFSVNGAGIWLSSLPNDKITQELLPGGSSILGRLQESNQGVNVAIFRNVKGDSITIQTSRYSMEGVKGSASNGGIAAFQIVPAGTTPQMEKK